MLDGCNPQKHIFYFRCTWDDPAHQREQAEALVVPVILQLQQCPPLVVDLVVILESDILFLKHDSKILRHSSNPACDSRKIQVLREPNSTEPNLLHHGQSPV